MLVSDWRLAIGLFTACWVVYHANLRPIGQVDTVAAPYAAWSLVRHASFDLRPWSDALAPYLHEVVVETGSGAWISKYPPGSSLTAAPFVLPFALARAQPLGSSAMKRLGKLVAASCAAAAAVLFYFTARAVAPGAAGLATLLFALGSPLWPVGSQALWTHAPATLWLCLALFVSVTRSRSSLGWPLATGFALGMAIATRPSAGLFALASVGVSVWLRSWRETGALIAGVAPPAGMLLLYNALYFAAPISGGYGEEASRWTMPLGEGLAGLLIAPSRGILVYVPALLLLPWALSSRSGGGRGLSPEVRATLVAWLVAAAATVVLYAHWHMWWGGWCFGPRFLIEALPILCLAFALAYARIDGAGLRGLARGLVAVSVAIQFLGVFGNDRGAWNLRNRPPDFYALDDTQIGAHLRHLLRVDRAPAALHQPD